jgi:hypothetical protein
VPVRHATPVGRSSGTSFLSAAAAVAEASAAPSSASSLPQAPAINDTATRMATARRVGAWRSAVDTCGTLPVAHWGVGPGRPGF